MPTIDDMVIVVSAKTEAMRSEFKKAVGAIQTFEAGAKRHLSGVYSAINGLSNGSTLALLRANPIVAFATSAVAALQNLDQYKPEQLGILAAIQSAATQARVTAEEFQVLRASAESVGAGAAVADTAIANFAASLDAANPDILTFVSGLEQFGVRTRANNGEALSTIEVLRGLADTYAGLTTEEEKARLATAAFGAEGKNFAKVIAGGRAQLDALASEAVAKGEIISNALVKAASEADQAWSDATATISGYLKQVEDRAKAVGEGIVAKLGDAVAEVMGEFGNLSDRGLADLAARTEAEAEKLSQALGDLLRNGGLYENSAEGRFLEGLFGAAPVANIQAATAAVDTLKYKLAELQKIQFQRQVGAFKTETIVAGGPVARSPVEIPKELRSVLDDLEKQTRASDLYARSLDLTAEAAARLRAEEELRARIEVTGIEVSAELRAELDRRIAAYGGAAAAQAEAKRQTELVTKAEAEQAEMDERRSQTLTGVFQSIEEQIRTNAFYIETLGLTTTETALLRAEEEALAALRRDGVTLSENERQSLELRIEQLRQAAVATDAVKKQMEAIQAVGQSVASALDRAFSEFLTEGEVKWKSFAASIANELSRLAIKMAVIEPLFGGQGGGGGLFGQLLGTVFGGGTAGGGGGLFGQFVTSLAGAFGGPAIAGARAMGGPVDAGRAYLVGERGPELVVPRSPGTVIPNGGARGGFPGGASGGGSTVTIVNQIDARGADISVAERIERALAMSERGRQEPVSAVSGYQRRFPSRAGA